MAALTPPDILYKYLPPERLDVLLNGLIRYTQFGAFNDPFEGLPNVTGILPNNELMDRIRRVIPDEVRLAYGLLPPEIQARIPYEIFSKHPLLQVGHIGPAIFENMAAILPFIQSCLSESLDKKIGALSLSEAADNELMWSHYSLGHAGFVIGFDATHQYFNARLSESDEFRHLRRVEYRNERPNAPLSSLNGIETFLVKSAVWAYEKEWRIMRPLADAEAIVDAQPLQAHLLRYPSDAVKEIIFGAKILPTTRSAILEMLKVQPTFRHVVIKQANLDKQTYGVRLSEFKN